MSAVFDEEAMTEGIQTPQRELPQGATPTSQSDVILRWDDLKYEVKSKVGKDEE
ncbi:hypothetical protein H4S07_006822, partial [Coemansia furcata]